MIGVHHERHRDTEEAQRKAGATDFPDGPRWERGEGEKS